MKRGLSADGITGSHAVMAAIAARIARPGSSQETDKALAHLVQTWRQAEQRTGFEVDASPLAYALRREKWLDPLVPRAVPDVIEQQRIDAVSSLLWTRGWRARAEALSVYSRFTDFAVTDRLALEDFRASAQPAIDVSSSDWRERADTGLVEAGQVVLDCGDRPRLGAAIASLTTEPTEYGSLLLYPVVIGVETRNSRVRATVAISDGVFG